VTWRAHLTAVKERGGASPELISGDGSEEQDECDGMATVAGDRFLAVNAMPDLVSRHGGAEVIDREDGSGRAPGLSLCAVLDPRALTRRSGSWHHRRALPPCHSARIDHGWAPTPCTLDGCSLHAARLRQLLESALSKQRHWSSPSDSNQCQSSTLVRSPIQ
jgi:hypothetical protein